MNNDLTKRLQENVRMSNLELVLAYETELAKWRAAAYYLAGYMGSAGRRGYPLPQRDANEWIEEAFGQGE